MIIGIHNSLIHPEGNKDDTNEECGWKEKFKCEFVSIKLDKNQN